MQDSRTGEALFVTILQFCKYELDIPSRQLWAVVFSKELEM